MTRLEKALEKYRNAKRKFESFSGEHWPYGPDHEFARFAKLGWAEEVAEALLAERRRKRKARGGGK